MTLPGHWLYAVAARILDPATLQTLIAPAIADLQYEVTEASSCPRRRSVALCRGYIAAFQLVGYCLLRRLTMRRWLAVFFLGSAGGVLAIAIAASTRIGPAPMIAFLATAVMSVAVLRIMRLGPNYTQAFVNCMGVGLIMVLSFVVWVIVVDVRTQLPPWYAYAGALGFLTACVVLGSALAAALVWTPPVERQPRFRLRCIQILTGCAVFAAASILTLLSRGVGANLYSALSWAAFSVLFFAAVSSLLYVPVLLAARRIMDHRLPLAVLGAMLFPVPLIGIPFLQGRGSTYATMLSRLPAWELVALALPYVLGGVVLGWMLGQSRQEEADARW